MKEFKTERLILREWKLSDSQDLFEYAKSELVGPKAGWAPHKTEAESVEIIKNFIEEGSVYAIELASENKVVGGIGLHKRTPKEELAHLKQREFGYVLNPKYWGQGIVPEAVKCLIQYGFEDLNLDIIWCGHYSDNVKSKRVIEKVAFKYDFTKNEILKALDNKAVETLYYTISKDDYYNHLNKE